MIIGSNVAAVVTGGASGLGEATARALAARGAKVALFDLNAVRGERVAQEIGGLFCTVDVASEQSVEDGLARARSINGQERIAVNCAGIVIAQKTAAKDREHGFYRPHELDAFVRVITVNLVGLYS